MSLLNSIYNQVESLPTEFINNSCFILTDTDLQTVRIELSMYLDFNFEKPLEAGTLLGFPVYLDPSRSESVFGDPRFYDIDSSSLIVLEF